MIKSLIALGALATTQAAKKQVATFSGTEVVGTVTVDVQTVTVDLDVSAVVDTLKADGCITTEKGLGWHIHDIWDYTDDTTENYGAEGCAKDKTNLHIDPWNACGSASANTFCSTTLADTSVCLDKSDYSPSFETDVFSAEVGDWSGKYGTLMPDDAGMISGEWSDFYEVIPSDVAGLSVVFHCADGSRIFCAQFQDSTEAQASTTSVSQSSDKIVEATFEGLLSKDSMIRLYPDGGVKILLDASEYDGDVPCDTMDYTIWTIKDGESYDAVVEGGDTTACTPILGAQWDPTNQCLPWVSSDACDSGKLCENDGYSYSCGGYATGRYDCAPGDLSGKFGQLTAAEKLEVDITENDYKWSMTPDTSVLASPVLVVLTCPPEAGATDPIFACSVFQEVTEDMGDDDMSGDDDSMGSSEDAVQAMTSVAMTIGAVAYAYN